jgi:hypothetical protein
MSPNDAFPAPGKKSRTVWFGNFGNRRQIYPAYAPSAEKKQKFFEPRGDKPVYCSDCYRKVRDK